MMRQSPEVNELATALSKAQSELKLVERDSENPHFKSAYASLEAHQEACRGVLLKHGLSYTQLGSFEEGSWVLTTTLLHQSGQWMSGSFPLLLGDRQTMQALGSAITYARRYGLSAILGLGAKDDDAEEVENRNSRSTPWEPSLRVTYPASQTPKEKLSPPQASSSMTAQNDKAMSMTILSGQSRMVYAKGMQKFKNDPKAFSEWLIKKGYTQTDLIKRKDLEMILEELSA